MAEPLKFPAVNFNLTGNGDVADLPAHWDPTNSVMTTAWVLTDEERRVLSTTGIVWVQYLGTAIPPTKICVMPPIDWAKLEG